jgi:hypothetical protein
MVVKKKPTKRNESALLAHNRVSCADVIRGLLSKVPKVDAIFILTDDANVVHVFSVVHEFQPKIYDKLLKKERAIEKGLPEYAFDFHVRAHQGRPPVQAVPVEAELVYAR